MRSQGDLGVTVVVLPVGFARGDGAVSDVFVSLFPMSSER